MKSEKVVKDIERRSVVVDGMSQEEQDIATAIELAPVSDRGERRELLRLFRQRRGPRRSVSLVRSVGKSKSLSSEGRAS